MTPGAPRIPLPARVDAIDAVRGGVMILMALDHVRDFLHRGAMTASPTDLATTTPALFLTRWVTHLCAPTFIFTAGLAAFLWWRRGGRTRPQLAVFLATRGLWLILLEVTVMRLAYNFTLSPRYPVLLLVLWVIGVCMIGLALLIWLPIRALAILSVTTIALHNALDPLDAARFGDGAAVWHLMHQPGAFPLGGTTFIVGYPLLPWIAVMALGFCGGRVFLLERAARQRILVPIGALCLAGFVVVRALNRYGDPAPWAAQRSAVYTALSFLDTTKYPPSLDFLLMTLGPALLALACVDRWGVTRTSPLAVFGRVPLFYFVLHFYVAHAAAVALALVQHGRDALRFAFHPVPSMGGPGELFPTSFGYDLWVVYLVWILIVLALYPVCRWFAATKATRREWWLGYL